MGEELSDKVVANALASALKKPLAGIADAVLEGARIAGRPLGTLIGSLDDGLRVWRWCNRVEILKRAAKRLERLGVDDRQCPETIFVPIIGACGNVSEESLQELRAALIASAVQNPSDHHPRLVAMLKEMGPAEAVFLKQYVSQHVPKVDNWKRVTSDVFGRMRAAGASTTDLVVSLDLLESLGIFKTSYEARMRGGGIYGDQPEVDLTEHFVMTPAGARLLFAVGLVDMETHPQLSRRRG